MRVWEFECFGFPPFGEGGGICRSGKISKNINMRPVVSCCVLPSLRCKLRAYIHNINSSSRPGRNLTYPPLATLPLAANSTVLNPHPLPLDLHLLTLSKSSMPGLCRPPPHPHRRHPILPDHSSQGAPCRLSRMQESAIPPYTSMWGIRLPCHSESSVSSVHCP